MPVVSAAGYPYQPFPSNQAPPTPPHDYQNIPTTPNMFGAQVGAQEERLGEIGMQGANQLAAQAVERQQLVNQIASDQVQANYNKAVDKVMRGDPNAPPDSPEAHGFFGQHGQDAVEAGRTIGQKLDQIESQYRGQLTNSRQIIDFNQYTRRFRMFTDRDIGSHLDIEAQKYGSETQKSIQALAIESANAHYLDPDRVEAERQNGIKGAVREAGNLGAPPDSPLALQKVAEFNNNFAVGQVNSYLAAHNPEGAKKWLETNSQLITNSSVLETVNTKIRNELMGQVTRQATAGSMGGTNAPVTPYKAGEILTATGATQEQFDTFRMRLANHESRGYSDAFNAQGYGGRYGMSMKDARESAARLGITAPTQAEFLANKDGIQDKLFEAYEATGHEEMMHNAIYANASPGQKLALLSAWHLTGGPNLNRYLSTGHQEHDVNGTTPSQYITSLSQALGVKPVLYGSTTAANLTGAPGARAPDPTAPPANGAATSGSLQTLAQREAAALTFAQNEARRLNLDPDAAEQVREQTLARVRTQYNLEKSALDGNDGEAAKEYTAQITKPGADLSGMIEKIGSDNRLKWETQRALINMIEAHPGRDTVADYGTGFSDAMHRVMLPPGDPNRLVDVAKILDMAGRGGTLTVAGARELISLAESRKTVYGEGEAKIQQSIFSGAEEALSQAMPGLKDSRGKAQFAKFVATVMPIIEDYKNKGLSLAPLADLEKGPLAYLLKSTSEGGLKRTMAEQYRDLTADNPFANIGVAPGGATTGAAPAGPAPPIATPTVRQTGPTGREYKYDAAGNRIGP
jgi:hypothetical protein